MLRHRYGSPTAFAVSCLGKEKNKIVKIFGLSLSMSIVLCLIALRGSYVFNRAKMISIRIFHTEISSKSYLCARIKILASNV